MPNTLIPNNFPLISQAMAPATAAQIDAVDTVIYVTSQENIDAPAPAAPLPAYFTTLHAELPTKGHNQCAHRVCFPTVLPNEQRTQALTAIIKAEYSMFDALCWSRKVIHKTYGMAHSVGKVIININLNAAQTKRIGRALLAALLAQQFKVPTYKSKATDTPFVRHLTFHGLQEKIDFSREIAMAEGNNCARALTMMPANYLTPALYRKKIETLTQHYGWNMHFYGMDALQDKQAGAFLAVCQGSTDDDAGIVHLSYTPPPCEKTPNTAPENTAKTPRPPKNIALVGKGICFDTGGTNLKPARGMVDMYKDMEGSAVALGILIALTKINYPYPVDCWLALAQNHIGPNAYKQSDVITAMNGTRIEVVHTDAEGRMVLADTLTLANQNDPALIIDFATLTGSCVQALGTGYAGAFTNYDTLLPDIIEAGQNSGERVWPFPMDNDYDTALDSQTADIKQCSLGDPADHILAARFLSRFVGTTPWIHVDLSSGKHKGGLAHIPTDISGFGIRFTLDLLLDKKIVKELKTLQA